MTVHANTNQVSDDDVEVLIAGVPTAAQLDALAGLRNLIIPWAGLPVRTRELLLERPHLSAFNLHHNAAPAAELAITLFLAATKRILPIDRALRRNEWSKRYESERTIPLIADKQALVLGYGAIGRRVAQSCQGLGMQVAAIRRSGPGFEGSISLHSPRDLQELLLRTFALFVCLPHTPATSGLLQASDLSLLPDGAVVVNVARGKIVDEAALFAELRSGRISAGLDVWYNYPENERSRTDTTPSNFPFAELDNVVMTPHIGGNADSIENLRMRALAELLSALTEGRDVSCRVDPQYGY